MGFVSYIRGGTVINPIREQETLASDFKTNPGFWQQYLHPDGRLLIAGAGITYTNPTQAATLATIIDSNTAFSSHSLTTLHYTNGQTGVGNGGIALLNSNKAFIAAQEAYQGTYTGYELTNGGSVSSLGALPLDAINGLNSYALPNENRWRGVLRDSGKVLTALHRADPQVISGTTYSYFARQAFSRTAGDVWTTNSAINDYLVADEINFDARTITRVIGDDLLVAYERRASHSATDATLAVSRISDSNFAAPSFTRTGPVEFTAGTGGIYKYGSTYFDLAVSDNGQHAILGYVEKEGTSWRIKIFRLSTSGGVDSWVEQTVQNGLLPGRPDGEYGFDLAINDTGQAQIFAQYYTSAGATGYRTRCIWLCSSSTAEFIKQAFGLPFTGPISSTLTNGHYMAKVRLAGMGNNGTACYLFNGTGTSGGGYNWPFFLYTISIDGTVGGPYDIYERTSPGYADRMLDIMRGNTIVDSSKNEAHIVFATMHQYANNNYYWNLRRNIIDLT